jgi:hypothetical protein
MTELDTLIAAAFQSEGDKDAVNKVYLTLLQATLFVPVEKKSADAEPLSEDEEPFKPLFANLDEKYFLLTFDTLSRLTEWAGDQMDMIDYVELVGRDLISGINESVFLCLNLGSEFYKEFSPEEVKHLKLIVSRINQLKGEV